MNKVKQPNYNYQWIEQEQTNQSKLTIHESNRSKQPNQNYPWIEQEQTNQNCPRNEQGQATQL